MARSILTRQASHLDFLAGQSKVSEPSRGRGMRLCNAPSIRSVNVLNEQHVSGKFSRPSMPENNDVYFLSQISVFPRSPAPSPLWRGTVASPSSGLHRHEVKMDSYRWCGSQIALRTKSQDFLFGWITFSPGTIRCRKKKWRSRHRDKWQPPCKCRYFQSSR